MLDMKNTHWGEDGEQQTCLFTSVSDEKKKKIALRQTESELDEIFGELRANNHCTPQPQKCFGLSETFCLTWNERLYFSFKPIQIF